MERARSKEVSAHPPPQANAARLCAGGVSETVSALHPVQSEPRPLRRGEPWRFSSQPGPGGSARVGPVL